MSFLIIIVLILLLIVWPKVSTSIKGAIGEKTTSSILYFLDKSTYKVINNIVLEVAGRTTQIDHLVISDFGVFVIETKNYKGWILGGENSEYWTQVLYRRKEKLYNPVRQNLGHINSLKSHLREYPNLKYISIILFHSRAEIKVSTKTDVIYPHQLVMTIQKYTDVNLTEDEKDAIFQRITTFNRLDTYDKRGHIKSIRQMVQRRTEALRGNKCPRCGGNLVRRNGKFGIFFGCDSYPKCKFILNS